MAKPLESELLTSIEECVVSFGPRQAKWRISGQAPTRLGGRDQKS